MHPRKSQRHVNAANSRWRNAEARAQAERDAGIPDEPMWQDRRQPFDIPLKAAGYRDLRIEPRLGYVAWRAIDAETGELLHCAAIKELLRWVAKQVPRQLGAHNFH
jgi:hypothetical protein